MLIMLLVMFLTRKKLGRTELPGDREPCMWSMVSSTSVISGVIGFSPAMHRVRSQHAMLKLIEFDRSICSDRYTSCMHPAARTGE